MTNGRNSLNRGGGSGGECRDFRSQPNRSSRDAPERYSPGPMNQPRPPTHARGSRRGRGGGAWSTYAAPPPPQPENGGLIQVRGRSRKAKGFRAFWFSVSVELSSPSVPRWEIDQLGQIHVPSSSYVVCA